MVKKDDVSIKNIEEIYKESMGNYAPYIILNRAIPDVRDGLKPVQRRIMYTLHEQKLLPNSKHMKVARISGQALAYHPHGDSSINEALIVLSRSWDMMLPLINIHGSNGSIDGSVAAAPRYISGRQSEYAPLLLTDISKNAVPMLDNFDSTLKEPMVLPASIPNAMINGTKSGVAVGVSTVIAPHNPNEMMNGLIARLTGKIKKDKDIFKYIKGPDFPTKCEIIGTDGIENLMLTGRGKITMQSKMEIVIPKLKKDEKYIHITSLPYGLTTEQLINSISKVSDELITLGVKEFRDETQVNDVSIKIICDKDSDEKRMKMIRDFLIMKTDVRMNISPNNTMVHDGRAKSLTMLEYLDIFIEFRTETLMNIWQHDLNKYEQRLEIVDGLLKLKDITDEIIKIAKKSDNKSHMIEMLIKKYKFTERQSDAIASTSLYQLGKQDFTRLEKEKDTLESDIKKLNDWLTNNKSRDKEIVRQFRETKKLFKDMTRQSEIIDEDDTKELAEIRVEDTIEAKDVTVVIKRDLTIQRIGTIAYQNQSEKYTDDDIVAVFPDVQTTDYVIAISKEGHVVTRLVHDLPHENLDTKLDPLSREITKLKSDDEFVGGALYNTSDERTLDDKVLILSEHGYVKLSPIKNLLPSLNTKRYVKNVGKASGLKSKGDSLVFAKVLSKDFYDTHELRYQLKDKFRKSGGDVTERVSSMKGWYEDMDHGAGSSGVRKINTVKNKEILPYISHIFAK